MITVRDVSKKFGSVHAVKSASFHIGKGGHAAFIGRSGAGKSTLMNLLAGYLCPTQGTVLVNGIDMLKNPVQAKTHIGFLPALPPLYSDMTVGEYLNFVCGLRRICGTHRRDFAQNAADVCHIDDILGQMIWRLTDGEKKRAALAGALCGDPEVIICDEPTLGLEPVQAMEMRNAMLRATKHKTLIIATSVPSDATDLCDMIFIMRDGCVVAEDKLRSLSALAEEKKRVWVRLAAGRQKGAAMLSGVKGTHNVEYTGSKEEGTCDFIVESFQRDVRADIFRAAADAEVVLLGLKLMNVTLEDIFSDLTSLNGGLVL